MLRKSSVRCSALVGQKTPSSAEAPKIGQLLPLLLRKKVIILDATENEC